MGWKRIENTTEMNAAFASLRGDVNGVSSCRIRKEADGSFSIYTPDEEPDETPTREPEPNSTKIENPVPPTQADSTKGKPRKKRTKVGAEKLGYLVDLASRCPQLYRDELCKLMEISESTLTHSDRMLNILNSILGSAQADARDRYRDDCE